MLRLNVVSDLHYTHHRGGAAAFYESFEPLDPDEFDATAVLGDIDNPAMGSVEHIARHHTRNGKPCVYVPGNHDFYRGLDGTRYSGTYVEEQTAMMAEFCRQNGITYLSQFAGNIVSEIDGVRFIGLTGWPEFARELIPASMSIVNAMSLSQRGRADHESGQFDRRNYHNDFREIRVARGNSHHRLTPRQMIGWSGDGMFALEKALSKPFEGETVLLTHVGPASLVEPGDHAWLYGSRVTELLSERHNFNTCFHGHTHKSHDLSVGNTRVISNARGYPGENPSFDPRMIVEIGRDLVPTLGM